MANPAIPSLDDVSRTRWDAVGAGATRIGLALVFAGIGAMKFTVYEAEAIQGLVASSPLTSWLYSIFGMRTVAGLIGIVEIAAAVLLLAGFRIRTLGTVGAALCIATLAVTSSLLLTAPVIESSVGWPALNVLPGQFLLKDLALLGAAIWLFARDRAGS